MSFMDKLKKAGAGLVDTTTKIIKSTQIESQKKEDVINKKKQILFNLSVEELKKVATLGNLNNLEYREEMNPQSFQTIRKKVTLSKLEWVNSLSSRISYRELIDILKSLKKMSLADELKRDCYLIEEKYEQKKQIVSKGEENTSFQNDVLLNAILTIITKSIISFIPDKKHKNEANYQSELAGHLKADLQNKFTKEKVFVELEYVLPSKARLDLYVQVSGYRIGIETKHDLSVSGQVQRLLGQIYQYSEYVDALIVCQYKSIENKESRRLLTSIKEKFQKPVKIIANGVEIID